MFLSKLFKQLRLIYDAADSWIITPIPSRRIDSDFNANDLAR